LEIDAMTKAGKYSGTNNSLGIEDTGFIQHRQAGL